MFLGHFALGFAAKRLEPRLSLGAAFAAAQFLDLVWPVLVLAGVERVSADPGARVTGLAFESYPFSHSLLMALVWAVVFGGVWLLRRPARVAAIAAALVFSHWVLDWISHRPDLPIAPGASAVVGLGLWNSLPATLAVEFGLLGIGVVRYLRATVARDRRGSLGFVGLVLFLMVVYAISLAAPPKAGTPGAAIAGPALAMWLIVWWGAWVDSHRDRRPGPD
jgi:hypothetical protein